MPHILSLLSSHGRYEIRLTVAQHNHSESRQLFKSDTVKFSNNLTNMMQCHKSEVEMKGSLVYQSE